MVEITALTGLVRRMALEVDRPVSLDAGMASSSHDFVRRVRAWHAGFSALPGQRFALHDEDGFEFAAALLGAWHAGKIVYLPADTLPSTVQALAAQVDGFVGSFENGLRPDSGSTSAEPDWGELDQETSRLVLYTSGSEGDPVAIGKCLRQLDSEIATLELIFGTLFKGAHVTGTVSHQHIYGLLFRLLWPLAAGRPFARHRLVYPEQIAAIAAGQPTVLVSSPALLKRLPEAIDWSSPRTSLRAVFSSGGPLSSQASIAVERLWGRRVIEVFGSTETGGIATRSGGEGSWQPLPGVKYRVVDEALQVHSRHLAEAEWFATQDRAQAVGEGFLLLGRSDRLVKLEERRISLDAIERALLTDDRVDAVRVLVLAGAREKIAAAVVLSQAAQEQLASVGRKLIVDRLRAVLRSQIDPIAIPKLWRFVGALPVNAQGKTTQRQLLDLFQPDHPTVRFQECDADTAKFQLDVTRDMPVFDGHFPEVPILPGVALIQWAIASGRGAFGISAPFLRMEALKFQQLVRPETLLHLDLRWRQEASILQFTYGSIHGPHASGRIVFADTGGQA